MFYGSASDPITLDDRLLAHVRTVVVTKLRRGETFTLSWQPNADGPRETVWVHAAIPLRFVLGAEQTLNRPLLVEMMDAANSVGGLDLTRIDADRAVNAGERSLAVTA